MEENQEADRMWALARYTRGLGGREIDRIASSWLVPLYDRK